MQIGDICTRNVVHCNRKTTALELAQMMRSSHVGDVVVVDEPDGERIPVGIVTDRDLVVQVMALEADPTTVTAGDLISGALKTAGEANTVYEIAELMRSKGVRRVPVVNEHGGLVGIVALDDLLKVIGEELTLLGRVFAREQMQEHQSRR
ncbi:MAG TPA: CBS domain-containing protein [Burkholderiales bacterium]|jgi:CBS domain-containing protein